VNIADELRKKVSHHGLPSLTPDERAQLPELVLDDAAHRAWFDATMEEMGGSAAHAQKPASDGEPPAPVSIVDQAKSSDADKPRPARPAQHGDDDAPEMPSADRIYTVQVIWDEAMADTSAKWLAANPGGHLILLAGNGHCHDSAIINRMKRRGITDALSVRGVIDDGEGSVGEALARPINDYILVLQMPPDVHRKTGDDKDDR